MGLKLAGLGLSIVPSVAEDQNTEAASCQKENGVFPRLPADVGVGVWSDFSWVLG